MQNHFHCFQPNKFHFLQFAINETETKFDFLIWIYAFINKRAKLNNENKLIFSVVVAKGVSLSWNFRGVLCRHVLMKLKRVRMSVWLQGKGRVRGTNKNKVRQSEARARSESRAERFSRGRMFFGRVLAARERRAWRREKGVVSHTEPLVRHPPSGPCRGSNTWKGPRLTHESIVLIHPRTDAL